jgi:phenylpyruvate tautomerase PptA (4-oxalocrotonate tautomerase family)
MPLIEVKLFERRLEDPEIPKEIIKTLTDGLCSVIGGEARDETWVVVEGVSPRCWGIAGETADTRR